jgi:uncharacterized OB-fold protein
LTVKFGYTSWVPETEMIRKLSKALKQGKLLGTRCMKCGERYLPPRSDCRCGSKELEWYEAPTKGKLLSFTTVIFPPESMANHAPYIVGVAELLDGSRLLAHVTGATPQMLKPDTPIQVVPDLISEDRIAYKFIPYLPEAPSDESS